MHPLMQRAAGWPVAPGRQRGFTLIEMLCVVAMAGILASIAYPGYQGIVHKARRTEALVALMQVQSAQERYRSNHMRYGTLHQIGQATHSPNGHYTVSLGEVSTTGYEAMATAAGHQAADADCRVLRLVVEGLDIRQSSGPDARTGNTAAANRHCWRQ